MRKQKVSRKFSFFDGKQGKFRREFHKNFKFLYKKNKKRKLKRLKRVC